MSYIQAILLGIIQGITEFFPISSSGHLIVLPSIFGWDEHSLVFDTTLHLGTASALLIYFFKDYLRLVSSFIKDIRNTRFDKSSQDTKMLLNIIVAIIPAGIIGFLFEDVFENVFRGYFYVSLFLFLGTILIYIADKYFGKNSLLEKDLNWRKSLIIGLFQCLALFPGFSRSGSTISGGMFTGLKRENAARFSFLLSVPIVVLAGIYKGITSFSDIQSISLGIILTGFLSSFIVGIFSIDLLLKFLKKQKLTFFIIYRLILVIFLLSISLL